MNFHFTEEEQDILNTLQDFCEKEVGPVAAEIDEEEKFPENARNQLGEMGFLGIYFPEEYGGAGMTPWTIKSMEFSRPEYWSW